MSNRWRGDNEPDYESNDDGGQTDDLEKPRPYPNLRSRKQIRSLDDSPDKKSAVSRESTGLNNKHDQGRFTKESSRRNLFDCSPIVYVPLIFSLMIGAILLTYLVSASDNSESCKLKRSSIVSSFPNQHAVIWDWTRGVEGEEEGELTGQNKTKKRNRVHCAVFLYRPEVKKVASCLTERLAKLMACNFDDHSSNFNVKPADFSSNDEFGEYLEQYRMQKRSVMIFEEANSIDSEKAQMFHTLCDSITPFINPAVYILAVPTEHGYSSDRQLAVETRRVLSAAWRDLPSNVLEPLLSRIMGFVAYVRDEPKLPCAGMDSGTLQPN